MVFSQQHGVLRKLVDDGARLEQEYLVEVAGDPPPAASSACATASPTRAAGYRRARSVGRTKATCASPSKTCCPASCASCAKARGWKCGASAACASARCRWPGYRSANGATSASTNASERSFETTQGAPRRLPADPPVHGDERTVAGVAQGVGDLGHRAAFGQASPRFEQASLGSPARNPGRSAR